MRSIEVDVMLRLGILIFKTNIKKVECCLAEALRGISHLLNMEYFLQIESIKGLKHQEIPLHQWRTRN